MSRSASSRTLSSDCAIPWRFAGQSADRRLRLSSYPSCCQKVCVFPLPAQAIGNDSDPRQPARPVFLQDVLESPVLHVDGKHIVVDQAAAEFALSIWLQNQLEISSDQVLPKNRGHIVSLSRVDVAEQDKRPQQHLPMLAGEMEIRPQSKSPAVP